MDPLSIVLAIGTLCSTVSSVALKLKRFGQDTSNVDRSIIELQGEVDAIKISFDVVKNVVTSDLVLKAEERSSLEESTELWSSVHGIIADCQTTLDRLQDSFVELLPEGINRIQQSIRCFRLSLKHDDISSVRTQLRTHASALQIVLQMVNLRATRLSGDAVEDKIDMLRRLVESCEEDRRKDISSTAPTSNERLHKSAMREISSATSVSSSSEAGASLTGEALSTTVSNLLIV